MYGVVGSHAAPQVMHARRGASHQVQAVDDQGEEGHRQEMMTLAGDTCNGSCCYGMSVHYCDVAVQEGMLLGALRAQAALKGMRRTVQLCD